MQQKRLAERIAWLAAAKEGYDQLHSVVKGLYDEVDKLCRKWPTMPVSQLTLDRTNKAITAVRGLLKSEGDEFLQDIHEMVPAGDLPEHRDVVLTLREVKDALERFRDRYRREWQEL